MRVLVTGAEGFIGKYVCDELELRGYQVVRYDKKSNPNHDLLYDNELNMKPFTIYCGAVIHLAALVGLHHCYDNPINAVHQNLLATTRLLETVKNSNVKFIYCSTWAVEGNLENPYDITKNAAEKMALHYFKHKGVHGSVIRFGTTYGKGMSQLGVIPSMLSRAKDGKPLIIKGRGDQIRQFTHASDIARGVVDVLEKGEDGEIYTCVSDEVTSIKEIAEAVGGDIEYQEARPADEDYKKLDNYKLRELGWEAKVKFKEGMEDMK